MDQLVEKLKVEFESIFLVIKFIVHPDVMIRTRKQSMSAAFVLVLTANLLAYARLVTEIR